jgi:two-component system, response regulator PdtaR
MTDRSDKPSAVLLVEDEPLIRMVVTDYLAEQGVMVLQASGAADALDILEHRSDVGVLFTDINMPGLLDGADLAQAVAQRWPQLRLLLTTGKEMPSLARIPVGCEFVPKPFDLEKLSLRIHALLQR